MFMNKIVFFKLSLSCRQYRTGNLKLQTSNFKPQTSNLKLQTLPQNTYDAIIVGSGISGGWAAKELCEKGLKVLLLERGRNVNI
jgi:heterodisulfide reductase subunit A-like polyferredoxin